VGGDQGVVDGVEVARLDTGAAPVIGDLRQEGEVAVLAVGYGVHRRAEGAQAPAQALHVAPLGARIGVVYDLTAWINRHPGGDKNILSLCGLDGTAAYNSVHAGQSKPANVLAGFEIGLLK
jgi:hypothetical protein